MMTTRLLPREEWHRLEGCGMDTLWARLPETTRVVVVEQEGQIVGCVTGMLILHAEGLWIDPAYRKQAGLWRRLMRAFWNVADEFGTSGAWASEVTPEMQDILIRLQGAPVPGSHFILPRGN
jgi:hypothetical protein